MTPFRNMIIQGDCTKALPMLHDNTVDLVLTDPPYVRNYRSRDGRTVRNDNNSHGFNRHSRNSTAC